MPSRKTKATRDVNRPKTVRSLDALVLLKDQRGSVKQDSFFYHDCL